MDRMVKRPVLHVRAPDAPTLQVLGAGVRFVCEKEDTDGRFSVMVNDLPFGAGPPPHHHDWDEGYFIIEGAVDFTLDGQAFHAAAGDFLLAPAGTVHTFSGAWRDGVIRLLVIDAPAHAAGFFRAVDDRVKGEEDLPRVPLIGEEHGIHFVR